MVEPLAQQWILMKKARNPDSIRPPLKRRACPSCLAVAPLVVIRECVLPDCPHKLVKVESRAHWDTLREAANQARHSSSGSSGTAESTSRSAS